MLCHPGQDMRLSQACFCVRKLLFQSVLIFGNATSRNDNNGRVIVSLASMMSA